MEKNKSISQEYQDFLDTKGDPVPESVSDSIFSRVWTDLNPPALSVFAKLALIQLVVGVMTLLFCPQFGVALTSSMGLMHYLMQYGESVCMFGCGAFFVGSSLFVSSLFLRPEEVRVIRKHRVVQIASIATLSIVALSFFGGQVELTLGLVWVLGALIGGATFLQLGWGARKLALRYGM